MHAFIWFYELILLSQFLGSEQVIAVNPVRVNVIKQKHVEVALVSYLFCLPYININCGWGNHIHEGHLHPIPFHDINSQGGSTNFNTWIEICVEAITVT